MKLVLVGLYCGPLLTLKSPLAHTQAKTCGSGNRVSGFRVSGDPLYLGYITFANATLYKNSNFVHVLPIKILKTTLKSRIF